MWIFLDDERHPSHVTWTDIPRGVDWRIVRNYEKFYQLINSTSKIDHVSFDHDLGLEHYGPGCDGRPIDYSKFTEKTGLHCAKALVDWCMNYNLPLPPYTIHSMNPVGSDNIRSLLENYKHYSGQ